MTFSDETVPAFRFCSNTFFFLCVFHFLFKWFLSLFGSLWICGCLLALHAPLVFREEVMHEQPCDALRLSAACVKKHSWFFWATLMQPSVALWQLFPSSQRSQDNLIVFSSFLCSCWVAVFFLKHWLDCSEWNVRWSTPRSNFCSVTCWNDYHSGEAEPHGTVRSHKHGRKRWKDPPGERICKKNSLLRHQTSYLLARHPATLGMYYLEKSWSNHI